MIQKDRGDIIKDTIVKEYIGNPEIFADVFNFFLYDGEQKIKPEGCYGIGYIAGGNKRTGIVKRSGR